MTKKNWNRLIIALLVISALFFLTAYFFITIKGKAEIIKQLEGLTHKKTTVRYFGLTPFFHLAIKGLDIEGLAKVDAIYITPSIPRLLTGKLILNSIKLVRPRILYVKSPPAQASGQEGSQPAPALFPAPGASKQQAPFGFKRFKIKEGTFEFVDQTVTADGVKIILKNIEARCTNIYFYPNTSTSEFSLDARIPWSKTNEEGKVDLHGWINFSKKDMEASLKINDIDGVYLYPYYATWVDLNKARIEKAKLNFSSQMTGKNNNLKAQCHLELADIVRRPLAEGEDQEKAARIADAVLSIFKTMNNGKIVLDFIIRTKMDRPQFGFSTIKNAFEDKIILARGNGIGAKTRDAISAIVKVFRNAFNWTVEGSKSFVSGAAEFGSRIGKGFQDVFKIDGNQSENN